MAWTYFGIFLIVVLLGSDPPANQVVPHSVGKSKVVIPSGCHISVLDQRKVEMSVEILLQFCDVFNAGKASHWNLFLSIMIRQGFRHGGTSCNSSRALTLEECKQWDSRHTPPGPETRQERHPHHRLRFSILKAQLWILSRGWSGLYVLGKGWGTCWG